MCSTAPPRGSEKQQSQHWPQEVNRLYRGASPTATPGGNDGNNSLVDKPPLKTAEPLLIPSFKKAPRILAGLCANAGVRDARVHVMCSPCWRQPVSPSVNGQEATPTHRMCRKKTGAFAKSKVMSQFQQKGRCWRGRSERCKKPWRTNLPLFLCSTSTGLGDF